MQEGVGLLEQNMIRTKKLTPLAYGYRVTSRRPPKPELTLVMRAKLRCRPGQPCELVRRSLIDLEDSSDLGEEGSEVIEEAEYILGQGPLRADVFLDDDDDRLGHVVYPSDFAEFKPKTDVMLKGTCHPRRRVSECDVSFSVEGRFEKTLKVVGPRVWVDKLLGGKFSDPVGFDTMPIDYTYAFGGPEVEANPVGKGQATEELPNVEDPRQLLRSSGQRPAPGGFGPLNAEWHFRHNKLGINYGDDYEKRRAPWYPDDYDWTHQNAAPADQQLDGPLRSDETLRFVNLHRESDDFSVTLPGIRPRALVMLTSGEAREVPMTCDTLFVDLDDDCLYLTWRGVTEVKEDDLSDIDFLLVAHEMLADPPLAAEHYLQQLHDYAADPVGLNQGPIAAMVAWEEKLERGEHEQTLDQLPDETEPVTAVFGELIAMGPDGQEQLTTLHKQMVQMEKEPGAREALIVELRRTLQEMREGGGGARPAMDMESGEVATGPFMRNVLRQAAESQREAIEAGAELGDYNEQLIEGLRAADLPGASEADLTMPDPTAPPPEPAPFVDFSGHDLSGRDLSGLDLHGCIFDGCTLRKTNFEGANLRGASFVGAGLASTNLQGADCEEAVFTSAYLAKTAAAGAKFIGATLDQASAIKADFRGTVFTRAKALGFNSHKTDLTDANFDEAVLQKVVFDNCQLDRASFKQAKAPYGLFRETTLQEARFDHAEVSNCAFLDCDLRGAVFFQTHGDTTNFKGSNLRGADLSYAKLPSGVFMGVQANQASFRCADMPRVRFYRAVLREADLSMANMLEADVRKTSLTDARFEGANLYKSAFIEAFGTDADFRNANIELANFKRNKLVTK
jgi:uncharacterized protein YjbI with pentapeptide repeats